MRRSVYFYLLLSLIIHFVSLISLNTGSRSRSPPIQREFTNDFSVSLADFKPSPLLPPPPITQTTGENPSQPSAAKTSSNSESPKAEKNRRLFLSGELDAQLEQLNHIEIEPEYGFSDDARGSIELIIIVDESGKPQWVITDKSELDISTANYIIDAFKQMQFSQPKVKGKSIKAILRIELKIGESPTP